MDELRTDFTNGRRQMLDAFVALSDLARFGAVDFDTITRLHGQFFDGNVAIKRAFGTVCLLAELR